MSGIELVVWEIGHHVWRMHEREGHGTGGPRGLVQEGVGGMRAISRVAKILDHVLAWNDA